MFKANYNDNGDLFVFYDEVVCVPLTPEQKADSKWKSFVKKGIETSINPRTEEVVGALSDDAVKELYDFLKDYE